MAHEEIKNLPADLIGQVNLLLARGESCQSVADLLQNAGHFPDLKPETLKKRLTRYRVDNVDIPAAAREKSIARAKNPQHQRALLKAAEDFDTQATWIELIRAQKKRVFKWFESGASNLPSTAIREDIKLLGQMLKDYSAFQLEIGEIRRAPRDVRALVEVVDEGELPKFEVEWREQAEVRRVIEEMMKLMQAPDGGIPLLEHRDVRDAELEVADR